MSEKKGRREGGKEEKRQLPWIEFEVCRSRSRIANIVSSSGMDLASETLPRRSFVVENRAKQRSRESSLAFLASRPPFLLPSEPQEKESALTEFVVLLRRQRRRPEFCKHGGGALEGIHQELAVLFVPFVHPSPSSSKGQLSLLR